MFLVNFDQFHFVRLDWHIWNATNVKSKWIEVKIQTHSDILPQNNHTVVLRGLTYSTL